MSTVQDSLPVPLTYDAYLREGEVHRRYDILDGVRQFMTNPTRLHQEILLSIANLLRGYSRTSRAGKAYIAPCDVLIHRFPLRTRQPDVLFISNERAAKNPPVTDPAPLDPAPELVVEIISPSGSVGVLAAKLADYQKVGVRECWIVEPERKTVELLSISDAGFDSAGIFLDSTRLISRVFPDLEIAVADVFADA